MCSTREGGRVAHASTAHQLRADDGGAAARTAVHALRGSCSMRRRVLAFGSIEKGGALSARSADARGRPAHAAQHSISQAGGRVLGPEYTWEPQRRCERERRACEDERTDSEDGARGGPGRGSSSPSTFSRREQRFLLLRVLSREGGSVEFGVRVLYDLSDKDLSTKVK
eukprot:CAMPEP_0179987318 /NCGR_PEP_ID=MMETSP0984-20121128/2715_1 /TAXON_ID=483367 /ORGANISM="non described non described, Strain CCMP 2436" /LENGTH=168 /DNA_ID=CAMNT_0021906189 /DNA_START=1382 /DNA_END=1887 /DNA_ORIENTATION=-